MTLPTMIIKGLLSGNPYPELEGTCYICSSSGFLTTIEFEGKISLGIGTKNSVNARITNVRDKGKVIFEINGQWSSRLAIRDNNRVLKEFDVDDVPITELRVKPLDEQSPVGNFRSYSIPLFLDFVFRRAPEQFPYPPRVSMKNQSLTLCVKVGVEKSMG